MLNFQPVTFYLIFDVVNQYLIHQYCQWCLLEKQLAVVGIAQLHPSEAVIKRETVHQHEISIFIMSDNIMNIMFDYQ